MKRFLFEFEDLPSFPDAIRQSMTDYLRYFLNATGFYRPTARILADGLERTGQNQCIDLCAGGGGAIESVLGGLKAETGKNVRFVLTDKFPNIDAFEFLKRRNAGIGYIGISVDAANVPADLKGIRTMYSAIHHFDPDSVKAILRDAVKNNAPIFIFDGGDKNLLTILGIIVAHPIIFFFCTPFFRPFRWSRLLFTYLILLIPLCTIWDGAVSITRLYRPEALLKIAGEVHGNYNWQGGRVKNRLGMRITYLSGFPPEM